MSDLTDPSGDQLAELARIVGERHALAGGEIARYLVEPRGLVRGGAAMVLCPDSTETVAAIIRFCAKHRIGVIPYGGGTGVVGGQVSPDRPLPV
ncbi:MAG TPA: FAD-binding protein, partial [Paracoccaceae bacterium]|nr:FAD-binding protein [Paracoccaceae bacterium]